MFNIAPDSANKPLVLWLNGGPGCSSLDGWANEHGPMMLDEEGHFHLNNYTWVNAANMIYLESPGGVGFSYINSTAQEDLYMDDNTTAKDNLQALLSFFEKFPEMKENDFYISGESYGGIYVPILAYEVIEYNKEVEDAN
jgi:serine carboxypeptidase-like clade 2